MSSNWFPTKVYCFHECLLAQFWLFALNISVHTEAKHRGNRYPAARNSASPPETFTQQLNTPGTVTILQGVYVGKQLRPWQLRSYKMADVGEGEFGPGLIVILACHEDTYNLHTI